MSLFYCTSPRATLSIPSKMLSPAEAPLAPTPFPLTLLTIDSSTHSPSFSGGETDFSHAENVCWKTLSFSHAKFVSISICEGCLKWWSTFIDWLALFSTFIAITPPSFSVESIPTCVCFCFPALAIAIFETVALPLSFKSHHWWW